MMSSAFADIVIPWIQRQLRTVLTSRLLLDCFMG
jgi:hypothetical protein